MPDRAPENVLIIEDDLVLSLWMEDVLQEAGSRKVTCCSSTAQAMVELRDGQHDLVVLDVHLADRDDGWAVAELIDTVTLRRPRIVFSTGSPGDIPESIGKLGTILEKPYSQSEFIAATRLPGKPERRNLLKGLASIRG